MARELDDEDELAARVRAMRVVAVVGMRDERKADQPGHRIPRDLLRHGVRVIPVNPNITSSLGLSSWPDLASIPEPFDVVNVFRRIEAIPSVADQILALPVGRYPALVWLQTGIRHDPSARRLVAAGIDVVQDRCLGVYATIHRP